MSEQTQSGRGDSQGGQPANPSRRRLFAGISLLAGGLIAAAVGVPALGMFLGPWLERAPQPWRSVGPVDKFKIGETVDVSIQDNSTIPWTGITGQTAVWLRRDGESQFVAFAVNCTHLGCPVRWEAGAELFLCPCHGGVYYSDGSVAAGPPPRALNRYPVRVNNGVVEIQAVGLAIG